MCVTGENGEIIERQHPIVISQYNKYMCGADLVDIQ